MLLIREVARFMRDALAYSVATRRIGVLLVIVLTAVVVFLTTTVTTVGPVAVYPFL